MRINLFTRSRVVDVRDPAWPPRSTDPAPWAADNCPLPLTLMEGAEELTRDPDYIVLHCTATDPVRQNYTPWLLQDDHRQRGWLGVGYHFYVTQTPEIYQCRGLHEVGAHCRSYNRLSLGVAYEGGWDSTTGRAYDSLHGEQEAALRDLLSLLHYLYPRAELRGHRDMPGTHTACPALDARARLGDLFS